MVNKTFVLHVSVTLNDPRSTFSSVQSPSHVWLWDPMDWSTTDLSVHHQFLELTQLMSLELAMPSNDLILCRPLLLPSIFPSIRIFSSASVLPIKWPKYWSFSFSISPSNEYSGLIAFRLNWLDHLAVQETLKSSPTPQFKSINSLALSFLYSPHLLSHPYMTNGKTIPLTRWTFVGKVMYLLFNMLSSLLIAFFPRSKCLLISWLHSPSAVILEPKKIVCHCFHCFSIYLPWNNGTRCHDLSFLKVEL